MCAHVCTKECVLVDTGGVSEVRSPRQKRRSMVGRIGDSEFVGTRTSKREATSQ